MKMKVKLEIIQKLPAVWKLRTGHLGTDFACLGTDTGREGLPGGISTLGVSGFQRNFEENSLEILDLPRLHLTKREQPVSKGPRYCGKGIGID